MKILISHVDADGHGVTVLAEHFQESLGFDKLLNWDYDFEFDEEKAHLTESADEIVIADLSVSEEYFDKLVAMGKSVVCFDHHDSSVYIKKKPGSVHDKERSGTKIFFEEYVVPRVSRFKPVIREYVELIHTYDTWQKESPLWAEAMNHQRVMFKYAAWNIPDERTKYDRYYTSVHRKFNNDAHWSWNTTELRYIQEALAREEQVYQSALKELSFRTDSKGRKFAVFSASGKISITCDRLLRKDNIPVDYLIVCQTYRDEWGKMSCRSRDEHFDCTTLSLFNGHVGAAGGTLEPADAKGFFRNDTWTIKYKDEMVEGDESFIFKNKIR